MVPEGWRTTKLGNVFKSRREKGSVGLPTISVTLNNGLVPRASLERKTDTNLSPEEHLLVRKGDIAYNMMRMWQGASGLAQFDALVSPAYVVLRPAKDTDPVFASYLFKSARMIHLFWAYSYGLTSDRLRLYFADFSLVPVALPSADEQRRIGELLAEWDKVIAIAEKLIQNGDAQKRALMQKLLSVKHRPKDSSGNRWDWFAIKDFGKVITGSTPPKNIALNYGGKYSWATAQDFSTKYISNTKLKLSEEGAKSARLVPKDSVLVTCIASIGLNGIAAEELATNQQINAVVVCNDHCNEFLYYLLEFHKKELLRRAGTTAVPIISKSEFEKIKLYAPQSKQEQQRIASILSCADRAVATLIMQKRALEEEKRALMQQLLTGKRRVNEIRHAESLTPIG
jgi:type I restriction enzyme S subunit